MTLVITACTHRKRIAPAHEMRAATLGTDSLASVCRDWTNRVRRAAPAGPASCLYCGRSFLEASKAAKSLGSTLAVVSAGLGFIHSETLVPSYGLTVVAGAEDNVLSRIAPGVTPSDWWARVSTLSIFSRRIAEEAKAADGLIMVALSEIYLAMVSDELANLPQAARDRLRIFTGAPAERIDPRLQPRVMPYNDRFDGPDSPLPGTRSDFASRSARHFAEVVVIEAPKASAETHAKRVRALLENWRGSSPQSRPRKTDAELLTLVRNHWEAARGRPGRLLRALRDHERVACAQERLARLAAQIRNERAST